MQSLIAWLNGCSWPQLSTIAQPWTAPVSVLGHSWPTFSLFQPVQSFLFNFLWAQFFYFAQYPKRRGGVNNFRVTLLYVTLKDPRPPVPIISYGCWAQKTLKASFHLLCLSSSSFSLIFTWIFIHVFACTSVHKWVHVYVRIHVCACMCMCMYELSYSSNAHRDLILYTVQNVRGDTTLRLWTLYNARGKMPIMHSASIG